jgi:hypothetical protein
MLFDSLQKYQNRDLDISGLQQNASLVMSAMEGDVPKEVRDAGFSLEGELDSIRFTVRQDQQARKVDKTFGELEDLIKRYD